MVRRERHSSLGLVFGRHKWVSTDRQLTPHPKEKAAAKLDWAKILLPKRQARQQQPEANKASASDARHIIERRRQQQLSESASTSSFPDSFRETSARNSLSFHESRTGGKTVNTEPQLMIGSMSYAPQARYGQYGLQFMQLPPFGGQATYSNVKPLDW